MSPSPDRVPVPGSSPHPVLVVGSVAYDDIHTPYGHGRRILGGSASYAALAASYFTGVRLVGIVGRDFDPAHRQRLSARGIDLSGLQVDESGETFFWAGRYHENFDRRDTLETRLNVFEHFQPNLPPAYRASRYVLLGNIMPKLQFFVLDQLEGPTPFVLADTMDLWVKHTRDDLLALLPRVDLFLINDDEAAQLTGHKNVILAGRSLLELGPKRVIIKKGSHGAVLFEQSGLFALPAYPVTELRDPTGAGDSFAGALLGYLAARDDVSPDAIRLAIAYATVTASLTVEAFSCDRLESAGATALSQRYDELRALVHLPV